MAWLPSTPVQAVVTGSAGFIGGHLVDALIGMGHRVIGVDRSRARTRPGYSHLSIDLADDPGRAHLADAVAAADVVFHLAARPGVRGSGPELEAMRWCDNVVATRNLLRSVPRGTLVVATSSSSVYGGSVGGTACREDQPLRPRGGYARSKAAMEEVCAARRAAGGAMAVLRPFTVAGEGQRPDMAFSRWLDAARRGRPVRIFGAGNRTRDITDVHQVVEGLIRAGERRVDGTVNLGTGLGHRLIDMATTLLDVAGLDAEIVVQPVSADEVEATLADTRRCEQLLGFVPATDLPALLRRQVASAPAPSAAVAT